MQKLIFGFIGCLLSLKCYSNNIQELDDKFYVPPGSIYVSSDSIYVNIDNHFVPVKGIASDENGIYITSEESGLYYCLRCRDFHERGRCRKKN